MKFALPVTVQSIPRDCRPSIEAIDLLANSDAIIPILDGVAVEIDTFGVDQAGNVYGTVSDGTYWRWSVVPEPAPVKAPAKRLRELVIRLVVDSERLDDEDYLIERFEDLNEKLDTVGILPGVKHQFTDDSGALFATTELL